MRNGSHYAGMSAVRTGLAMGLLVALTAPGQGADAQVPRGRRDKGPSPTHVIVAEAECTGAAGTIVLRPGVAVAVSSARSRKPAVELAGRVRARCTVDREVLGVRLVRDVELPDGAGAVYAGALVRPVSGKAPRGTTRVVTAGAVVTELFAPSDALSAVPHPFLYREPPTRRWIAPFAETKLYAKKTSVGTSTPPVGVIAAETDAVLLEQDGALALVRSHGPVEIVGWALAKQFADRRANSETVELLKPTHEVFTGAALYPDVDATKPAAHLRGGALVEVNKLHGGRVKITTTGDVIATGFVDQGALRPLSSPGG